MFVGNIFCCQKRKIQQLASYLFTMISNFIIIIIIIIITTGLVYIFNNLSIN